MPNYGIYNKLLSPSRSREEANDDAHSQMLDGRVAGLNLLLPGNALAESLLSNNHWTLADGTYPPFSLKRTHGRVCAASAAPQFTRKCEVLAHASVTGVTFTDDDDPGAAELVRVGSDTAVRFADCTFVRSGSSPLNHVYMEPPSSVLGSDAGTAVFIGCTFIGGGAVTINNAGAAALVQMVGCVNMTGNVTFGTVTAIGTIGV